jgi:hypothetical protein
MCSYPKIAAYSVILRREVKLFNKLMGLNPLIAQNIDIVKRRQR